MATEDKQRRVLVVYYSRSGNTARVARDIAARLDADLEEIVDRTDRRGPKGYVLAMLDSLRESTADIAEPRKQPGDYALTIVGAPVWAWRMAPAARAYLRRTKGRAGALALFVTSGATDAQRIVPRMEEVAGRKALAFTGFDARTLSKPDLYDSKLGAFLSALDRARASASSAA